MDTTTLFTVSDAALRSVVDRLSAEDLDRPVPPEWSRVAEHPVVHDILFAHAYDEAWVPDLLDGKAMQDGDPWREADLLGDDPVAAYDAINDTATAAVAGGVEPGTVFRFQYGDYSAEDGFAHLATYRALQAWDLAHHLGLPFHLSAQLIEGLNEHVVPHADEWRGWGVFPPAIDPPAGADDETVLLATLGHWRP